MISRLSDFLRNPQNETMPSPQSLVTEPKELAKVTRLANGRFHLQWQNPAETTDIYIHTKPYFDNEATLWATVTGAQNVVVPALPDTCRPYFILSFEGNGRLLTGERFLPLPNSLNFRDIGGYTTENGHHVKWGQIYRSGSLANLDHSDYAFFDEMQLRTVFDLRSNHESRTYPDRLPKRSQIQHFSRPLNDSSTRTERVKVLRHYRNRIGDLLLLLYKEAFVDENAHHIGDVLTRIADPANRPALIHCSAGKDRTGITIALLLTILGVSEETIVADYSLSNLAHEQIAEIMLPELRQVRWVGVSMAKMKPVLLANPSYLRETLAYIRRRYGSIEAYLIGTAGMAPQTIKQLRQELVD